MINFNDPQKNQLYFEKLIQKEDFYSDTYFNLAEIESEFTDLVYFILNLESINNLIEQLLFYDWSETSTLKFIIENESYYNVDKRLNDFELYVTQYCVGVHISNQRHITLDDSNRKESFCKIMFSLLNKKNKLFNYKIITKHISYSQINGIRLEPNSESNDEKITDNQEVFENIISWKNEIRILAYLFWKMRQDKIFECENLGSILSKVFVDSKKNKIKNTLFNTEFSKFTNGASFPKKAKDIDNLIELIKNQDFE
jgi:hypothetical protein